MGRSEGQAEFPGRQLADVHLNARESGEQVGIDTGAGQACQRCRLNAGQVTGIQRRDSGGAVSLATGREPELEQIVSDRRATIPPGT
jgi:hypothetical protein